MRDVKLLEVAPGDIEKRSMAIIESELGEHNYTDEQMPIVKRCIHTSADFDYLKNLVITDDAVKIGVAAIKKGCTIVTDTQMARSGVNKRIMERFGGQVVCFISDVDVSNEAKKRGVTRATVSMERAAKIKGDVILAIGNAPTALIEACKLMDAGKFKPKLIIGAPVGFVNVCESKELLQSMDGEHIIAMGRKGGSNIAAAICNAMIYMASDNERE